MENIKDARAKLLTPEAQRRKSEGLKRHYATLSPVGKKARVQKAIAAQKPPSEETRKKIAETVRNLYGSMPPDQREAYFETRSQKFRTTLAAKAAAAGVDISSSSRTQPTPSDPPEPDSTPR